MAVERVRPSGLVDTRYPDPFVKVPPPVTERKPGQVPYEDICRYFKEVGLPYLPYFTDISFQASGREHVVLVNELLVSSL